MLVHVAHSVLIHSLILAIWMSASGLSLVAVHVSGELGFATVAAIADFPCAGRGCGCVSAEMCNTRCCCRPKKPEPAPCCPSKAVKPESTAHPSSQLKNQHDEGSKTLGLHLTIQSPECAGLAAWLLAMGANVHLPSPPAALMLRPTVLRVRPEPNEAWVSREFAPDPPPPRLIG